MSPGRTTGGAPTLVWLVRRALHVLGAPLYINAFLLWVDAAASSLLGLGFWLLAAQLYSAEEVGIASAALSALSLMGVLAHLGLGQGLVRFLPLSTRRARLVNVALTASSLVALALALSFALGAPLWTPRLAFLRGDPLYLVAFLAFAIATALTTVQRLAFLALRQAQLIVAQAALVQVGRIALALMLAHFTGFGAIAASGLATLAGAGAGLVMLARGLPGYRPGWTLELATLRRMLPFSVGVWVADGLLMAPALALPLLVVGLLGATEAGYFYVPWFLGYLLTSASFHLGLSLFAEGSHDPAALGALSRRALLAGLAVASLGALLFVILGEAVLLPFGTDYAAHGAPLLRAMGLSALPAAVVNVHLGRWKVSRRLPALTTLAALLAASVLGLSALLLPALGLAGAGVAHGVAQLLALGAALRLERRRDGESRPLAPPADAQARRPALPVRRPEHGQGA